MCHFKCIYLSSLQDFLADNIKLRWLMAIYEITKLSFHRQTVQLLTILLLTKALKISFEKVTVRSEMNIENKKSKSRAERKR